SAKGEESSKCLVFHKISVKYKNMHKSAEFSDFQTESIISYLNKLSRERCTGMQEAPYDRALYEEWQNLIPQSQFSRITLTATLPEFRRAFREALQAGKVDTFLSELAQQPDYIKQVYVVASPTELKGSQEIN